MRRRAWIAVTVAVAAASALPASASEPAPQRIRKISRAKIVGAPTLSVTSRPGLYVWLEDGCLQLAAVGAKPKDAAAAPEYRAVIASTMDLDLLRLRDFERRRSNRRKKKKKKAKKTPKSAGAKRAVIIGRPPARGCVRTDGDVEIRSVRIEDSKEEVRVFVGPLALPAAPALSIEKL